jgi:hypothetical protein
MATASDQRLPRRKEVRIRARRIAEKREEVWPWSLFLSLVLVSIQTPGVEVYKAPPRVACVRKVGDEGNAALGVGHLLPI